MGFTCVCRTHPGLRRKLNEDALLCQPDKALWAVADGMGGHEAGEIASGMIVDALGGLEDASGEQAATTLEQVNTALVRLAADQYQERTIGSTAVVLSIKAGTYSCLWVGDSRGYLLRNGALRQLTRDHSLVQDLVDAGMLEAAEAESHPNANVVTRAVGAAHQLSVDTVRDVVLPGDLFLLASDGLTKVVSSEELCALMKQDGLDSIADSLIETTLARGAPDNVTIILVAVD